MKNLVKLCSLITVIAIGAEQAYPQYSWTKDPRNPVLSGEAGNVWNHHLLGPCVLYNTDALKYEMWFCASFGPPWRPYQIGFATSSDGINWSMHPTPVLSPTSGTWDEYTIDQPVVLRENGQYKMWYSSWLNVAPLYPGYIGLATSPDGILWTKYSGNPVMGPANLGWDGAGGVYSCAVLPGTGRYHMWYAAYDSVNTSSSFGHAISSDGITRQRDTLHNPALRNGGPGQWDYPIVVLPQVLRIGGTYYMWYKGGPADGSSQHVGLATSTDSGITWTKYSGNPVMSPTAGSWDGSHVEPGTVLLRGGSNTLDMWYDGAVEPTSSYLWRIGHATSSLVSVGETRNVPAAFVLEQNYPNPFNPTTVVSYSVPPMAGRDLVSTDGRDGQLPAASNVRLVVYDVIGREVSVLVNEQKEAGSYTVQFNAGGLASGVYFYRLTAGSSVQVGELMLLK